MDDKDGMLQHTITTSEGLRSKRREKGILWPVRYLAREIGPRVPGSKGEKKAARFVERELKELGFAVETQSFRVPSTIVWSKILAHLLLVTGVLVFPVHHHLSYALVFAGFFSFLLEGYGCSPFAWMAPHRQSENVIARVAPSREPAVKLVLVAHLDSHYSAFYYRPEMVRFYRFFRGTDYACQVALFVLFTLAYGGYLLSMEPQKLELLWRIGLIIAVPPFLALLALFSKAVSDRASPGGNHNASGVALLLELARAYSRHQPHEAELWFAFTGASEINGRGVRKLVRSHRRELQDAYFIVLEGLGRGFPACRRKEGHLLGFRADRRLVNLAREIISSYTHYSGGLTKNRLHQGEAFHLLSRGYRAMSVCGQEESPLPRFWRWDKDDHTNVDPRNLRLALDFVRTLVDAVDHGGLGPKKRRVKGNRV